jgi:hypothetical protein
LFKKSVYFEATIIKHIEHCGKFRVDRAKSYRCS